MENNIPNLGTRKKFAKALAQKLIKNSKIDEAPVSLQKIIEYLQTAHTLDVQKIIVGEKISGLLVTCNNVDGEYAMIGYNANHSWYRRRFTIAHEIGHLLLGHTCNNNLDGGSHNETEANTFASELLIPKMFIKNDYMRLLNIKELSKLYRVSEQALSIKLMEDRII